MLKFTTTATTTTVVVVATTTTTTTTTVIGLVGLTFNRVNIVYSNNNKKAVLSQGNRAILQRFFRFKVRRQRLLQV